MTIKITGRVWTCECRCKSNCCSEMFLPLSDAQWQSFEKDRSWLADQNSFDWQWLSYHKCLLIQKHNGDRKITLLTPCKFEKIYNPHRKLHELHILDKCSRLLSNNKCKGFRARPVSCQKAECLVFSNDKSITFYAENGLLKEQYQKYLKGELKKYGD